jgi:hypothetical protein
LSFVKIPTQINEVILDYIPTFLDKLFVRTKKHVEL